MYSKSLGTGVSRAVMRGETTAGLKEPAYRQTVRVPPNYSGHAFRDGEERSPEQMVSGESYRDRSPRGEEPPTPRFEGLPRVSTLGRREEAHTPSPTVHDTHRRAEPLLEPVPSDERLRLQNTDVRGDDPRGQPDLPVLPACREKEGRCDPHDDGGRDSPSGLMERFPFGHGFGYEELLLVGLMLLLLHEGDGNGDLGETLVLLGVLLLCG